MINKKETILKYYHEGKSVDEILEFEPTYKIKYIKKIISDANKAASQADSDIEQIVPNTTDDIAQIKSDICEIKKALELLSTNNNPIKSGKRTNGSKKSFSDLIKVLEILKDNEQLSNKINLDVKISIEKADFDAIDNNIKPNEIEVLNPIETYRKIGKEALKEKLLEYDITALKVIVKRYTPDPRGYATRWKNVERIIDYIVERAESLSQKGNVFITT